MSTLSPKGALLIAGLSLGTTGVITAGIGPALADLASNTSSSLDSIGSIFSALFLGGLLTQLIGGPITDRLGQRPVMLAGLVLMALGCGGIVASRYLPLLLACALIAGLGRGAITISTHLLIARVFATRSAAALNLLNVFYGVGAVAGPMIAGATQRSWGSAALVIWFGAALLLAQVPLLLRLGADLPGVLHMGEPGAQAHSPLRHPVLWVSGIILLLYVGSETGFGGWILTYLERTVEIDASTAALMTSCFWLAITGGRVVATVVGTKLSALTVLISSMSGAVVGALLVVLGQGNAALSTAGIIVLGVSFGPIYPTTLSIVTASFRRAPGTATSIASAMGGLGGTLLPWLQGNLLQYYGPAASMQMIVITTTVMLGLEFVRQALVRRVPFETGQPTAGA